MELNPKIMEFYNDCGVSEIVGEKEYFTTKTNFIKLANVNFSDNIDGYYKLRDVEKGYVKWYDNPVDAHVAPLDVFEDGCYSFSNEDEEDSFEVYIINVQD